ncbi:hypothetical protein AKJ09_06318 [Labilithrix luteola]|uniref:Uncharacterized protein n=2 Tax=Labilithrix luteola TaxID=1391654 RepID=A0A0K1Q2P0_9BACT|nr:hypothetical protein AKJ09_06318 [Labilithrix luteola]
MLPIYRVTKYDPSIRASSGLYDEWTSVSDVGRSFAGRVVTDADYLAVEDAYVESVRRLMRAASVNELVVKLCDAPRCQAREGPRGLRR